MALQTELRKLYDCETQSWGLASGSTSGSSLALSSEHSRFSTYFHALMEVCLAVAEVTLQLNMASGGLTVSSPSSSNTTNLSDSSSSSSSPPGQTPQSPSLLSKRKKVKLKRDRATAAIAAAATTSGKRGTLSCSKLSECDSALLNVAGGKPEDMLWFHRALTLLMIIRHLTYKDPQGLSVTGDAVADACQALVSPTAHNRLLVLSGIPTHLEGTVVRNAIRRACNAHGGLFKYEIFIPLQIGDLKQTKGAVVGTQSMGSQDDKAEKLHPGSVESPDASSSATSALSMTASASTSQTSISSQGVSRTASELPVDQELLAATVTQPVAPTQQQAPLDPCIVSSQESLDISLCSTGSLGSLGSFGEQLDSGETASVSDGGSMYAATSLGTNASLAYPIKGYAVIEVSGKNFLLD